MATALPLQLDTTKPPAPSDAELLGIQRARVMCVGVAVPLVVAVFSGHARMALFSALPGIIVAFGDAPGRLLWRVESAAGLLLACTLAAGAGVLAHGVEPAVVAGTLLVATIGSAIKPDHRALSFGIRYAAVAFNIGAHQPLPSKVILEFFALGGLLCCLWVIADGRIWSTSTTEPAGLRHELMEATQGGLNGWRFAVCAGVTSTGAILWGDTMAIEKPYWVMVAALMVMHPDTASSLKRIAGRAAGVAGGALAALGVYTWIQTAWPLAAIAVVAAYSTPRAFARTYALGCAATTLLIMVIYDIALVGQGGTVHYLWLRVLDTLIGCAFATAGTIAAWAWTRRVAPVQD